MTDRRVALTMGKRRRKGETPEPPPVSRNFPPTPWASFSKSRLPLHTVTWSPPPSTIHGFHWPQKEGLNSPKFPVPLADLPSSTPLCSCPSAPEPLTFLPLCSHLLGPWLFLHIHGRPDRLCTPNSTCQVGGLLSVSLSFGSK